MKLDDLKKQARAAGVPGMPPPLLRSKRKVKFAEPEPEKDPLEELFEPVDFFGMKGFKKGVVAFPEFPRVSVKDLPKLPLPGFDKSRKKLGL